MINIQAGVSCKWTNDTQRFLLDHFDTIHDTPSQVYHSALPLCPSSSWLYECYGAELSRVRTVKGFQAGWRKCSRTVSLSWKPWTISYWATNIAVGLWSGDIITLDAVTGSYIATLSGHASRVQSVSFSSDGKLLVSGADDKTVKLWDMQTGGIIQDFSGHQGRIWSVSISADSAVVASGSKDSAIHLWDVLTGQCNTIIKLQNSVHQVCFSPSNPQQLVGRLEDGSVSHWDINGCQIGPTYDGSSIAFSSDGKQLAICRGEAVIVQAFESREIIAKFHVTNGTPDYCCFSPDGKLIAAAVYETAYVWDIVHSVPHPIETFTGHTNIITALAFYSPSSLISASYDSSVKFWKVGALSSEPIETNLDSTSSPSHKYVSTTLQAKDGIIITSDSDGTVKIWDISTGLCKESFQTPATDSGYGYHRDCQFIDGRLVFAWNVEEKIYIYGAGKGEIILSARESWQPMNDLRIGGDGSIIFCLGGTYIQAWSIVTGEFLGEVEIKLSGGSRCLVIDDLRVWACHSNSGERGWDFGSPGSSPIQLSNKSPTKLHPDGTLQWDWFQFKVQSVITGKVVFQLPKSLGRPIDVQWNNQTLFICFGPTEVLIFDFTHILAL